MGAVRGEMSVDAAAKTFGVPKSVYHTVTVASHSQPQTDLST